MNYSEKANPNATNSELDAKVIITQPELSYTFDEEKYIQALMKEVN